MVRDDEKVGSTNILAVMEVCMAIKVRLVADRQTGRHGWEVQYGVCCCFGSAEE